MKRTILYAVLALMTISVLPFERASAQESSPQSEKECSARNYRVNDLESYAESRDQRLPANASNRIDPGANGSIRIHAWSQSDVLVRACVLAAAETEPEARQLASQVKIVQGPGQIEPDGPSEDHSRHWDVSYEIWMPAASNLDAHANNGSISMDGLHGQIHFDTTNGSVHLGNLGGDVEGSTTNGSLRIELSGHGWQGRGLRAETTNGSVRVSVPENYSAKFEASTVNGGVHVDFPITVSGEIGKSLSFELGSGGSTVEARTTNGGIYIGRS
jgi:DUF4097 and DUF4098 domain-containing protein YvlB